MSPLRKDIEHPSMRELRETAEAVECVLDMLAGIPAEDVEKLLNWMFIEDVQAVGELKRCEVRWVWDLRRQMDGEERGVEMGRWGRGHHHRTMH